MVVLLERITAHVDLLKTIFLQALRLLLQL